MSVRRSPLVMALVALLLGALATPDAHSEPTWQGTVERRTMPADAVSQKRDYLLYTPPSLSEPAERVLVVFLHGCSQTANDAMDGVPWNHLADQRGFVIAYPEQGTDIDGSGARCWNTGQAPVYERGINELQTLARITTAVRDEFGIAPGRVFMAGISSGAIMTAAMAATFPDLYAAIGSVEGCGYPCADPTGEGAHLRMGEYARRVPGFFVTGGADYLVNPAMSLAGVRGWVGANDLADDGQRNGSVSSQPVTEHRGFEQELQPGTDLCLQSWNNPCPAGVTGWSEYPTTIDRYLDTSGKVVVESWLLHGLSHNYPGAHPTDGTFTDPHGPDITTAMYEFFLDNVR